MRLILAGICACALALVVPKGYFVSDAAEFIPSLALKWLLFNFGRRGANLEAARTDSFVADAGFTAVHQKIVLEISQTRR